MLIINESNRINSTKAICNKCKKEIQLVLHHDGLEAHCCNKTYFIKHDGFGVWNCCSVGENTPESDLLKILKEYNRKGL